MKKLISILLACVLTLSLAACGGEAQEETTTPEATNAATTAAAETTGAPTETTAAPETIPAAEGGYSFMLEGMELVPGAAFDAAALPAPESTYQIPSCAIEGTDNVYNYGTVEVTAFNDGSGEMIYSIYIIDANTPTTEGLYLGDTLTQVEALYGTDRTENGTELVYQKGSSLLVLIMDGEYVVSIEYRLDA